MKYRWLLIEVVVVAVGLMAARALKLSYAVTVTITAVPAFLVSYPFMKHWMPKASFGYWITAATISTAAAWLLYLAFTRLSI
jgi:hypothetical protein